MADEEIRISEDEYSLWLTPPQALALLSNRWTRDTVAAAIVNRARLGMIRAAAELTEINTNADNARHRFAIVPETYWKLDGAPKADDSFWKTGDIIFFVRPRSVGFEIGAGTWVSFTGVRFEHSGIEALRVQLGVEAPSAPLPRSPPPAARRGAKRKDWWDHLWIEMIRRIRAGTLQPKNPTELQEILEEYAEDTLNESVGDSTLKRMASNLFEYLQEIGGK